MVRVPITSRVHSALLPDLKADMLVIDATAGNGHDSLFLATQIGISGHLYAFDVQKQAIDNTYQRLSEAGLINRATLIHAGHETMAEVVPALHHGRIDLIMFNLGYLPGADKSLITRSTTTICALQASLRLLGSAGIISILAYPGHDGGNSETASVLNWAKQLPEHYLLHIDDFGNTTGRSPIWIKITHSSATDL